jgi:hypothetical protein
MSDRKNDDISGTFFVGQLRHLFDSSDVDERLRERVAGFLDSVDLFLELLLSVRALPDGEEFADERVIATASSFYFTISDQCLIPDHKAPPYEFHSTNRSR